MTKLISIALLAASTAFAQSITIPAQNVTVTIGRTKGTITIPAQTVPLPATLPAGWVWTPAAGTTPGLLTIPGSISASSLTMTGGPALPKSASGLYLWQAQATGILTPVPYVPFVLPTLTIVAK